MTECTNVGSGGRHSDHYYEHGRCKWCNEALPKYEFDPEQGFYVKDGVELTSEDVVRDLNLMYGALDEVRPVLDIDRGFYLKTAQLTRLYDLVRAALGVR